MIAIIIAIVAVLVITAMHLSHQEEIALVKADSYNYISDVELDSYRAGWMDGSADERSTQRKVVDAVILAHV